MTRRPGSLTPDLELDLGGLAPIEAAATIAARALLAAYPELHRVERPGDPPLIIPARALVDDREQLLAAIDNHRNLIIGNMPRPKRDDAAQDPSH
jgi:hypothetical protein